MEHPEHPTRHTWEARRAWLESQEETFRGEAGYHVGGQACALIADLQAAFYAGAWFAVIILAVIDAQLRETEISGFTGNTMWLLDEAGAPAGVQQHLRRRNPIVHVDADDPARTVDQQWAERAQLEAEARDAVKLMLEAFYMGPWV